MINLLFLILLKEFFYIKKISNYVADQMTNIYLEKKKKNIINIK